MTRTSVQIVQSLIKAPYINTKEDREIPNVTEPQKGAQMNKANDTNTERTNRTAIAGAQISLHAS